MSYKIRREGSQQIQVHGKWVDIPGTGDEGEQEVTGCRISDILSGAITTPEQFDQLIRNCMGLDDDPEHAEFIRELGAKLTPLSDLGKFELALKVGDRVIATKNCPGYFIKGQRGTVVRGGAVVEWDEDGYPRHLGDEGGPWEKFGYVGGEYAELIGRTEPPKEEQAEATDTPQSAEPVVTAEGDPEDSVRDDEGLWVPVAEVYPPKGTRVMVKEGVHTEWFVAGNKGTAMNGGGGIQFDEPYHNGKKMGGMDTPGGWYCRGSDLLVLQK